MPPRQQIEHDKRTQNPKHPPKRKGTGQGKIPVLSKLLKGKV